ncbi:hypothetical protein [Mycolicibacterium thermoresistibile]
MGLNWWPVAIIGLLALAVVVALALLLPMQRQRRELVPLANTARLTRLPEYARLARARAAAVILTIALLVLLFGAAVLASARPAGSSWGGTQSEAPEDIMLCVAAPLTDRVTGEFLGYFAAQTPGYGNQRIGLTSPNRRVVPLTRDYAYAAGRFGELAAAGQANGGDATFAPDITYSDYAPTIDDQIALCLTGFPAFDEPSSHRRSLIYLGPSSIGAADETRPALFTDQRVAELARDAGVQVNALAIGGREEPLGSIVDATGGQYISVPPDADTDTVTAHLDAVRAAPPRPSCAPATAPGRVSTIRGFR